MMGIQKCELLGWIRAQVDLCRLDAGMPEPERDFTDIASGLKRVHRTAMPQYMRCDVFCGNRRSRAFGCRHMLSELIGESISRHPATITVQEQFWSRIARPDSQPSANGGLRA